MRWPCLSPGELALCDALADRPEVLRQMGDEALKKLAIELTEKLRSSTTVDSPRAEERAGEDAAADQAAAAEVQVPAGGAGGGGEDGAH